MNFKSFFILSLVLLTSQVFGQCTIEPWSLEKRITQSDVVIEGKVVKQEAQWDKGQQLIYTLNTIEVYRVFKGGIKTSTITLATLGGVVGLEKLAVEPSLTLQHNQAGVFLLRKGTARFQIAEETYVPTASVQSFILYDLLSVKAYDWSQNYISITGDLYETIKTYTKQEISTIKDFDPEKGHKRIKALANPVITSFSVDTITAGTGSLLTINGSNFGFARGSGKVGFKDANFGDGRYYYSPTQNSYKSWSNSKIEVYVPNRAGTGKVEVVNAGGDKGESTKDLEIEWSHTNLIYPLNGDTSFYEIDHVNDNAAGGYTWQLHPNFARNTAAVASFTRSLEEWRCETGMNWNIGQNSTIDTIEQEGTNLVRFTEFNDSKLGVCYSWYSGCFHNGNKDINWFVREFDIEFDSTRNWYYGTGNPNNNQFDFQSVTTHELGHGHQLAHVRDNSKVMHYSIGPGDRKANLVATDIAGGNYVSAKSVASSPCGPAPMQKIAVNACTLRVPETAFNISDTAVCPSSNVVFTDQTDGDVATYNWDFGANASPATASTKGPHTVSYSSSGTKEVRLIATNIIGSDTLTRFVTVKAGTLNDPSDFLPDPNSCLGIDTFTINQVENAESYSWEVTSGGSIEGSNTDTVVVVDWTGPGTQRITVNAINECTQSTLKKNISIRPDPEASFSESMDGTTVNFTNESTEYDDVVWDFADGNTSTDNNPTHQFPDQGQFDVMLVANSNCASDTLVNTLMVNFKASVDELSKKVSVYPNPINVGNVFTVEGDQIEKAEFIDMQGKVVSAQAVVGNKLKANVAAGQYFLKLSNQHQTYLLKVFIE
jgi:PKD repeat protein